MGGEDSERKAVEGAGEERRESCTEYGKRWAQTVGS